MDTNVRILNEVAANFLLELLGNETCLTEKKEVTRKDQYYPNTCNSFSIKMT